MHTDSFYDIYDTIQNVKDIKDIKADILKIEKALCYSNVENKRSILNEIYISYPWIHGVISLLPTTLKKDYGQMMEIDYQYALNKQREILCLYGEGKLLEYLEKECDKNGELLCDSKKF